MRWRVNRPSRSDSEGVRELIDRITYWRVRSCVVRVINERLVENKTLVLL